MACPDRGWLPVLLLTLDGGLDSGGGVGSPRWLAVAIANARREDTSAARRSMPSAPWCRASRISSLRDPCNLELRLSLPEIAKDGLSKVPSTDSVEETREKSMIARVEALIRLGDIDKLWAGPPRPL